MNTATTNGTARAIPVNGEPSTLAEYVDDEARSYRCQGTPEGDFLAEQLERIAQLIAWTKATTPKEYADRLEIWDRTLADEAHQRGYSDGYDAARRDLSRHTS